MMKKMKLILLVIFPGLALILFLMMIVRTTVPEDKPLEVVETINNVPIVKVQAAAFCEYGVDSKGLDYGPGYCIVSAQGEIPLYSLLDVDIYGEAQAVATSDKLAPDQIRLWYNAPSKVLMFEPQMAFVRVLGMGDRPKNY
jgi:3D (Asp-Asp-Asp) domain-containing protein